MMGFFFKTAKPETKTESYQPPAGEYTAMLMKKFPLCYAPVSANSRVFKVVNVDTGRVYHTDATSKEHALQAVQWLNYDPRYPTPPLRLRVEND